MMLSQSPDRYFLCKSVDLVAMPMFVNAAPIRAFLETFLAVSVVVIIITTVILVTFVTRLPTKPGHKSHVLSLAVSLTLPFLAFSSQINTVALFARFSTVVCHPPPVLSALRRFSGSPLGTTVVSVHGNALSTVSIIAAVIAAFVCSRVCLTSGSESGNQSLVSDTTNVSSADPEVSPLSEAGAPGVLHNEVVGSISDICDSVSASTAAAFSIDTSSVLEEVFGAGVSNRQRARTVQSPHVIAVSFSV